MTSPSARVWLDQSVKRYRPSFWKPLWINLCERVHLDRSSHLVFVSLLFFLQGDCEWTRHRKQGVYFFRSACDSSGDGRTAVSYSFTFEPSLGDIKMDFSVTSQSHTSVTDWRTDSVFSCFSGFLTPFITMQTIQYKSYCSPLLSEDVTTNASQVFVSDMNNSHELTGTQSSKNKYIFVLYLFSFSWNISFQRM